MFIERIQTVIETCRRQGRDVVAYLGQSAGTFFSGEQARSRLPNA